MSNPPAAVRPASTMLLLRDGADGIEVFMVVRHHQIDFAKTALVIAGYQLQSLLIQVSGGELFGLAAELPHGRCSTVTPPAPNLATASSRVISPAEET